MTIVYAFLYSLSHSSHDGPNRAHALRCSGDLIWTAGSTDRQVLYSHLQAQQTHFKNESMFNAPCCLTAAVLWPELGRQCWCWTLQIPTAAPGQASAAQTS